MTTPNDPSNRIPEERVSAILKRAAELDRKVQESVELDAIRAAAVEAGISLSAVDRALEEYAAGRVAASQMATQAPPKQGWLRRWLKHLNAPLKLSDTLKYAGLGALAGLITATGEVGIVFALFALVLAAFRIVLQDRPSGRARRFLINMSLMTGAALFFYALTGDADEDLMSFIAMMGATLLPVGLIAIKTQARNPQSLEEVNTTS